VFRDTDTRRASRAHRPKAGRLPTGAERTGPANAPPRKRSATREQKAGIWRLMVHGTEKYASQYQSSDFVLAALELTVETATDAVLHALESRQRTERYAAREPRRREQDQPEPSPRRAAHPARQRRAHRDFETVRRNADSTRNTPRRTSQGTHRACRPRNPADQAASKRPATGTHRVFRDTDTRRASRAHRPKSRTPANRRRAYRPRKRAPEKDRPPGNKRPESGV